MRMCMRMRMCICVVSYGVVWCRVVSCGVMVVRWCVGGVGVSTWSGVAWRGVAWCGAVQCSAVYCTEICFTVNFPLFCRVLLTHMQ